MALALLPVLYVGAYFCLMDPAELLVLDGGGGWGCRLPHYRAGGDVSETAFRPALWIDRQLRPDYWEWEDPDGTGCTALSSHSSSLDPTDGAPESWGKIGLPINRYVGKARQFQE